MEEKQLRKLGVGINIIAWLYVVGGVIGIFSTIGSIFFKDGINEIMVQAGQPQITDSMISMLYISAIIGIIQLVATIMILRKSKIGVFVFFGTTILSTVYSFITQPVGISSFIGLILPVLLGLFIYKKKEVFGFGESDNRINM
jgi:hypothetical protein